MLAQQAHGTIPGAQEVQVCRQPATKPPRRQRSRQPTHTTSGRSSSRRLQASEAHTTKQGRTADSTPGQKVPKVPGCGAKQGAGSPSPSERRTGVGRRHDPSEANQGRRVREGTGSSRYQIATRRASPGKLGAFTTMRPTARSRVPSRPYARPLANVCLHGLTRERCAPTGRRQPKASRMP